MTNEAVMMLKNFGQCIKFEGCLRKPELVPILATEPMNLVLINLVKMIFQVT